MKVFSKVAFRKSKSGKSYRQELSAEHLDALEGKEVTNGYVEYELEGEQYFLDPVPDDWCREQEKHI